MIHGGYCDRLSENLVRSLGGAAGVERQRADVHRLAERLGVELKEIFEDNDVSAYTARKSTSAWGRALATIERERPDYLLVYRQDRIGRRLADIEGLDELCRNTGTKVHAAEGATSSPTPPGPSSLPWPKWRARTRAAASVGPTRPFEPKDDQPAVASAPTATGPTG